MEKFKNKKLLFLLALNSLAISGGVEKYDLGAKYDKLYTNMVKNIGTGKSNSDNYKLIEKVLNQRNKELKDLYMQSDYIVKPEYLEWQIFFTGFYENNHSGTGNSDGKEVIKPYDKEAKTVTLGMYVPIRDIGEFSVNKINELILSGVDDINPQTVSARDVNIFNIIKPEINIEITPPVFNITPLTVGEKQINLITSLTAPQVPLNDIKVFNLKLATQSSPQVTVSTANENFATGFTLSSSSTNDIGVKVENSKRVYVFGDSSIERQNASMMSVYSGEGDNGTSTNKNATISLKESNTVGLAMSPDNTITGAFNKSRNWLAANYGTITGEQKTGGGIYTKQIGLGYIPTGAKNIQVRMNNFGTITMKSPNSAGFLLMPDIDADYGLDGKKPAAPVPARTSYDGGYTFTNNDYDQKNVRFGAQSSGTINVYGSRSYGFMTSPYEGNDMGHNFGISTYGGETSIIQNTGTINVLGDESTGFAIKKSIHQFGNAGIINIGTDPALGAFTQDNVNGNTVYDESEVAESVGDPNLVERATGMYTSQKTIDYVIAFDDPTTTAIQVFDQNRRGGGNNNAVINIWQNATESSGLRTEGEGFVINIGNINIYGDKNYGIVARDNGRVINQVNAGYNPGTYNATTGKWSVKPAGSSGEASTISVYSKTSAAGYVDKGGELENSSIINVVGDNSAGFYVKSGTAYTGDRTSQPMNYGFGSITVDGKGSHGVLVTNEDGTTAKFSNRGSIETKQEGTVALYGVNGSKLDHQNKNDREGHFYDDGTGKAMTAAAWLAAGNTFDSNGECGKDKCYVNLYSRVVEYTDLTENATIKAGDGGTGIWVEQSRSIFTPTTPVTARTNVIVAAPIEVGNSTANYTAVGIYSDGSATVDLRKGPAYDTNPTKYSADMASIKVGENGIALLHNYRDRIGQLNANAVFGGSSGIFNINALKADLGNSSTLAYTNAGGLATNTLQNVIFTNVGNDVTFAYSANNGSINVNNTYLTDFLINPNGVTVGQNTVPFVAENGFITNNVTDATVGATGIAGLVMNTKVGLQSFSKNNTPVGAVYAKTKTLNNGTITMTGRPTDGAVAMYTKYGKVENSVSGKVNIEDDNSIGLYGIDSSQVLNTGTVNVKGNSSLGLYGVSDDLLNPTVTGASGVLLRQDATGIINVEGTDSAGIYGTKVRTVAGKTYTVENNGTINVNNGDSLGIYSDNVNVTTVGNINLNDISVNTAGNRVGVYAQGTDATVTTTGANINLGTKDQTNIAYYVTNNAKLSGANLETVSGYGILTAAQDTTVNNTTMPTAITGTNGQIGLALLGTNTYGYTGDITVGNTVVSGLDKFYGIAMYTDNQNISNLSNKLTAGANGVGLYAGGNTGSTLTYNGQIAAGDGITAGIGIFVKEGSNVNLASGGNVHLKGANGVGAYVENNGEFTFSSGSSMTFDGSGVGIWGENGSVINDDGTGVISSTTPGAFVIRSRAANSVINVTGPTTTIGNGIAGFVVNGEVNNLSGSTITASTGSKGSMGIAAEGYKTVGTNTYEANNSGIINVENATEGTAIYLKNARGINNTGASIVLGDKGVGIYGEGSTALEPTEIRNNGTIEMKAGNSQGLYGKGASLIENNGTISSNIAGNIGMYSKENTGFAITTTVNNKNNITLSDNGMGIYGENSTISNTGSITTGDKTGTGYSIGIYGKDSTITNTGNVKVGQDGLAFVGDNSTININSGNIDVSKGSLVYGKNNSIINYNLGDTTIIGTQPYISILDSTLNFSNPTTLTVSDNGTGVFVSGNTGVVTGDLSLNVNNNATGVYVKDLGTTYTNNSKLNANGTDSRGLVSENSNIDNAGTISVNGVKGVGLFSQLTKAGNTVINNTGTVNVNAEDGRGIYASAEDSTGTVLGSTTVNNNGTIALGNSADINTATQVGIYGTKGVTINNEASITGGSNVVGIYGEGATITTNGNINVGDTSTGVYLDGGNLTTSNTTAISTGNNSGVGIYASNGAQVLNNSSNITAGKNSALLYSKDSGTVVTNLADLSIGEEGIGFYVNGGSANNQGVLKATGTNAVFMYGNTGEIQNSNVLDANGNTGVIGIYGKNTSIQNTGDILTGDSIIGSSDPTQNSYSVGIYGDNAVINNTGKITLGSNGVGIYAENTTVTAVNTGAIESSKYGAIGVFADNGTIQNLGTITLSGDNSIGMAGRTNATIINDGQITINGNDGIGMYVTNNSHVYNNNVITINGANGTGIQIGRGSTLENRGTINLNGTNGQDVVYGEGTTYQLPSIINAGIINVAEKFEVSGVNVSVKVDPSTMRTPTASEITSGGYDSSDIQGKFLVSNAVQFNAPSISIDGPVNIMNTFSQGTNATVYKLENIFNPTTPWGGPNGSKISVISDSLTWDAIPSVNNVGGVDVWMQKLNYTDFAKDHWYNEFAGILDSKYENATGEGIKIYDKIDQIKTVEEFDHAMNSLSGNVYANINQREEDIARTFENSLYLLQDSKNNTKENVKVNVITGQGKTKEDTAGVVGYDYSTVGVLALREVERTYRNTFGYSLGYLHTGFEMDDSNSSEEWVDTLQLGLHNKYTANDWILRNDLTGRASIHNIDRNIDWTDGRSEMNGSYETYSITSDNKLGKEVLGGKNGSITAYAGIKAMYVTRPSFEEEGLERLQVEGNDAWSVKPKVGIEFKASTNESKNGWKLKGALDIAYEYELANLNTQEKARLVSIEDGYHNLAKPEEEKGKLRTKAIIGAEIEDRYGIFLTGEYSVGEHSQDDYRAGVTLKAVF